MSENNLEALALKWLAAFNTKDLDGLLSLYANDALHYSPMLKAKRPETNGLVIGVASLRSWWQDAFDNLPSLHYSVTSLTANRQRVFMEYRRRVNGEKDKLVAEVLEFKEGKIASSRVYHG